MGQTVGHHGCVVVVVFAHFGDADAAVLGLDGVLFVGQQLFVELLARTEAGVFHFDVAVRHEAGEGDHAAGQGVDLDGLAHVEDEYRSALRQRCGFHY